MMSKALGTRQSITDGGIYDPRNVCYFGGKKKPGLDTLSRPWEWCDPNRMRWHRPLKGWDWSTSPTYTKDRDDRKEMDGLVQRHIRKFWEHYGLEFPFDVEHKCFFERAAYWGKGDYAIQLPDGYPFEEGQTNPVYRLRGRKGPPETGGGCHPSFLLLDSILAGSDEFPIGDGVPHKSILTITRVQAASRSRTRRRT